MDIVGKRGWLLGVSTVVIAVGMVFLSLPPHLNLGIDFVSGTSFTLQFEGEVEASEVRGALGDAGYDDAIVQGVDDGEFFVRTRGLGSEAQADVERALTPRFGDSFIIPETTTVGKSIAEDTVQNAIIAIVVAATFVMIYIMYAFRSVPSSYRYAIGAVLALVHDVVIVVGLFAVLGRTINAEVNAIFIVGILTVIGYSVNDTIVVFDRIRENVRSAPNRRFADTVNISINESIGRSLGTSITTMTVVIAMLLFGGPTLRDFLIVLLAGVIVGTYSSIFIAAQLLVVWESGDFGKLIRRIRRPIGSGA